MLRNILLSTIILSTTNLNCSANISERNHILYNNLEQIWQNNGVYIYSNGLYTHSNHMAFTESGANYEIAQEISPLDKELQKADQALQEETNDFCGWVKWEIGAVSKEINSMNNGIVLPFPWLSVDWWKQYIQNIYWVNFQHEIKNLPNSRSYQHISYLPFEEKAGLLNNIDVYKETIKKLLAANSVAKTDINIECEVYRPNSKKHNKTIQIITHIYIDENAKQKITDVNPNIKYYYSHGGTNSETWKLTIPTKPWLLLDKLRNISGFNPSVFSSFEGESGQYTSFAVAGEFDISYGNNNLTQWWNTQSRTEIDQSQNTTVNSAPTMAPVNPNRPQTKLWKVWLKRHFEGTISDKLSFYDLKWNTGMDGSAIEIWENTEAHYINDRDQDFWHLFPITDRWQFISDYENIIANDSKIKKKKVALAFSGPRTTSAKNINWNIVNQADWVSILNWIRSQHPTTNPWEGFIYIDNNWKLQATKLTTIPNNVQNGFQERMFFSPVDGIQNSITKNPAAYRRIIKLSDWSTMVWQSNDPNQKMYENIDYDSNRVFIKKSNGKEVYIEKVMSIESQGCGEIYLRWMWGNASKNKFLSQRERGGTKPLTNVVVIRD